MKPASSFIAITTEGGLLPADFLAELLAPKAAIEGLTSVSYNLAEGERINEQVNRSWNRLKGRWIDFKRAIADKQPSDSTTTETRDRWLQPLFQELGYGQRLLLAKPIEIESRSYPVSHGWSHVPIHLLGSHIELDKRTPGAVGAAKASPHSLVQQTLNASEDHLWGIVSNGLSFRLLRDSIALTRLSYVEWDLAAIFDGDLYSEFFVLWLVAHQSRFDADRAEQCWLEKWKKIAEDKGLRALENLRPGVARAIEALGAGLLSHPANKALRMKLSQGELSTQDFYRQVLRVIYRMLFLFVAEDRDLIHQPLPDADAPKEEIEKALLTRRRYRDFYAITRLRGLTLHRAGTPHPDLWHIFQLLTQKLGSDEGCHQLALPPLGSFLWNATRSTPDLISALVSNRHFLTAVHALAFVQDGSIRRSIDYKNLGSEELGSVYEGLLELHPLINADTGAFELNIAAGNERKTSGSYYTPDSLVQCLLDSALEPVIAEAVHGNQGQAAVDALLKLKICDPAVGSGHFLIAAAHRLAKHVAAARSGDDEPSPRVTRAALRDVIGRCLYGVDINPMSAELCRVSLWLEALEPGKPLTFLDHHIRVGNSLLGATPELIARGLPDETFTPIQGDDKKSCAVLKKRNNSERKKIGGLFASEDAEIQERMAQAAAALEGLPDDRPEDIRTKELALRHHEETMEYRQKHKLADAWCAAFVIRKQATYSQSALSVVPSRPSLIEEPLNERTGDVRRHYEGNKQGIHEPWMDNLEQIPSTTISGVVEGPKGITQAHLNLIANGDELPFELGKEIESLSRSYRFFHWYLVFTEVFAKGGFDCVLGNPPWERVKLQEKEWFAERSPAIAEAPNAAARKRLIEALKVEAPALHQAFVDDSRKSEGESHLIRNSGRYPLCGRGDINVYTIFGEGMRRQLNHTGRAGCVLPSGIATDDTTKFFFQDLINRKSLVSLFSFENEEFIFPAVHHATRFCLLTVGSGARPISESADFVFFARQVEDLLEADRHFTLGRADIGRLNPNTRTCPIFRSSRDAELTKALYRRIPVLILELQTDQEGANPWGITFSRMFDMSNDSNLFWTSEQLQVEGWELQGQLFRKDDEEYLPLYEAKMIHHFDHRWGTYQGQSDAQKKQGKLPELSSAMHDDPTLVSIPHYWVRRTETEERLGSWQHRWLLGFRNVTRATDLRTVISAIIPISAVGHSMPVLYSSVGAPGCAILSALLASYTADYVMRQKLGGVNLTYGYFNQLSAPTPASFQQPLWAKAESQNIGEWILSRVLELTYTAWDLEPFAQDCGWHGPPFRWDEERRFVLRCELDAAFFHLYLTANSNGGWKPARRAEGSPHDETPEQLSELQSHFPKPRDAVTHILDTFPIVKRKEEDKWGEYRTKRVILEIYDALAEVMHTGRPYQTRLDPLPGDPTVAHGPLRK